MPNKTGLSGLRFARQTGRTKVTKSQQVNKVQISNLAQLGVASRREAGVRRRTALPKSMGYVPPQKNLCCDFKAPVSLRARVCFFLFFSKCRWGPLTRTGSSYNFCLHNRSAAWVRPCGSFGAAQVRVAADSRGDPVSQDYQRHLADERANNRPGHVITDDGTAVTVPARQVGHGVGAFFA